MLCDAQYLVDSESDCAIMESFRRHPHRRVHPERRSDGGRPRVDGHSAPTARVGRRDRASQRCRTRSVEATGSFRGRTRLTGASAKQNGSTWGSYLVTAQPRIRYAKLGTGLERTVEDRNPTRLEVRSRTSKGPQIETSRGSRGACVMGSFNSTRKKGC